MYLFIYLSIYIAFGSAYQTVTLKIKYKKYHVQGFLKFLLRQPLLSPSKTKLVVTIKK